MPLAMAFCLFLGAILQAVTPAWARFGYAKAPVLLGLVIYYAFTRERHWALIAAILAGILHDAQGQIPMGYSAACFVVVALTMHRFRDTMFVFRTVTHCVMGAASAGLVTVAMALLLVQEGLIEPLPGWLISKVIGVTILGAIAVPVIFRLTGVLDHRLGLVEEANT